MGVNFGLNAAAILGLFLAVAGAGLFFLRSVRPELARDYDIFFAAVGLLCGIILLFNGWRLEPILEFCIFMLTGTATFFAVDSIRMRGVTTEQARRNTETVDRDRPVSRSRVYTEAKVDRIDPYDNVYEGAEPNYNNPRLRGYDDPQPRRRRDPRRRAAPAADISEQPRRSRNRPTANDYSEPPRQNDRATRRDYPERPSRRPTAVRDAYDDWNTQDEWDDNPRTAERPSRRPSRDIRDRGDRYAQPAPPAKPAPRPEPPDLADLGRSYDEPEDNYNSPVNDDYDDYDDDRNYDQPEDSIPGDYVVDYQPISNDSGSKSDNYDDDGYDDYDDDYNDSDDEYDDYRDRPETRKPINFD